MYDRNVIWSPAVPGQGRKKIIEVREMESDISFLRNYLTRDSVDELDLYFYQKRGNEWIIVERVGKT